MEKIKFQDSIVIEKSVPHQFVTDAKTILSQDKKPYLKIDVEATHSGVLINRRVYPGKYVKAGYPSLFSKEDGGSAEYPKPILKHHDMYQDPIGRIRKASYSQLKNGQAFETDYLSPEDNGSKGSGIVYITADITDPDSIQKIVDSRYLSVSQSHHTSVFLCSICGDSLYDCDHMPGSTYNDEGERTSNDGRLCYGITGPMEYDEVSFVNFPASPPARLINYQWADSKSDWGKETITTLINRKKEAVRNLSICDSGGELSLLSGKYETSTKKTVVAVNPAITDKLKQIMPSEKPETNDEPDEVRQLDKGDSSGVLDAEQNLDKATLLGKETKMDDKKLEELMNEISSLKDKLATAEAKATDLQKQVEAKDSQINRLTSDASEIGKRMADALALSLASIRVRFDKLANKDKENFDFEKYVSKLSERSVESLKDSLYDLMTDLEQSPETPEIKDTKEVVKGDKLTSNTLANGDKPKSDSKEKKRALDRLSEGLGI